MPRLRETRLQTTRVESFRPKTTAGFSEPPEHELFSVMAGFVPAIHAFGMIGTRTWVPGTRPGMTPNPGWPVSSAVFSVGRSGLADAQARHCANPLADDRPLEPRPGRDKHDGSSRQASRGPATGMLGKEPALRSQRRRPAKTKNEGVGEHVRLKIHRGDERP